jgi:hypothetical protein
MEISITSDMSYEGTNFSADGKKQKGELEYLSFSVCKRHPIPADNGVKQECYYDIDVTATYCDEQEDGTKTRHQYNWHNQDTVVEDTTKVYDPNKVVADIVSKLKGKGGIL